MKKLVALFTAIMMMVTLSTANAVSLTASAANTAAAATPAPTERPMEDCVFLLDGSGRVIGQAYGEKLDIVKGASSTLNGILAEGKLLRAKNRTSIKLDSRFMVSEGGSVIKARLSVIDEEALKSLGINTAVALVDATIVAEPSNDAYVAYHRFLTKDAGKIVARLYVNNRDYIQVRLADWDGDGSEELCFRAGSRPASGNTGSSGGNGGNGGNNKPSGNPDSGSTQRPGATATPNPKNDPVVLPPFGGNANGSASTGGSSISTSGSSSSGSNTTGSTASSSEPSPENDAVKLPF